ncbi:dimethylsulfonioproprionate lyase family protein [Roseovarius sp. M141]|uniref:dimethylsulfonioproprionate lyase family protein n=1 Tax=Roseovarius sp. M141 TaxID=2583806 RepID=UPI0020CFA7FB|nr:dimethylsulfonioproprionate lyase family protein [Roseovarius sp. M141]MCQ0091539.1 transcriptional regulator [Roseovarius sp. M141]
MRSESLQDFLAAARTAFAAHVDHPRATDSLHRIFAALETPGEWSETFGARLPACAHLAEATDLSHFTDPSLRALVKSFLRLEPDLYWRPRSGDCTNAGPGFAENHANAYIVGPGGIERRSDVWIGMSLVAPNIRYPDHTHPPEETYLVLSPGQFMQGHDNWFEPGVGGTLYNPPGILHAMHSGAAPLLALWALWAEPKGQ